MSTAGATATREAASPAPRATRGREEGGSVPVSVVVPCYRCADTIERAVASVAAQTARPDELWLVDDGSGDDTPATLHEMRARYGDWVNVLALPRNGGPSVARNAGWERASRPYVAFLDADDAWHPEKLRIQHDWMARHPEIALSGHRYVRVTGDGEPYPIPPDWRARRVGRVRLWLSNCFPTRTVMVRRDLPQRFLAGKNRSEDYLLWLQIVQAGNPAALLDVPLAYRFKAPYGDGGLSGDLWKMELGELDTYRRMCAELPAGVLVFGPLAGFSLLRHLARVVRVGRGGGRAHPPPYCSS